MRNRVQGGDLPDALSLAMKSLEQPWTEIQVSHSAGKL